MTRASELWGADTLVSMPAPSDMETLVDFEGFGFNAGGITHVLSEAAREEFYAPFFAPDPESGLR